MVTLLYTSLLALQVTSDTITSSNANNEGFIIMGMYTEIFINADLKENTPKKVIEVLRAMCNKNKDAICLQDKPDRWLFLFNNGSYYTPYTECGLLTYDEIGKQYSILGKGDIKNNENEIECFFDYILPYCEDGFIGYMRYEEDIVPTLVYKN